jgi:hypothetical protein
MKSRPTNQFVETNMRNYRQWLNFVSYLGVAVGTALPAVASIANAASVPDFSGIWAHASWPGFEPPPLGPGPVTNKSRMRGGPQPGVSNPTVFAGDYTNPILKPQATEVVKRRGELESSGLVQPNEMTQCWPLGVPFIFTNVGMQMFQQQDKITIVYAWTNEVRRVRMNQPHPTRITPSWYGDSVGYYEGDTLVIDTVGIKADRPFAMVDMFGTPYSNALHVVERYRLLDYEAAKEGLAWISTEANHPNAER